jgi:hypothetical protein
MRGPLGHGEIAGARRGFAGLYLQSCQQAIPSGYPVVWATCFAPHLVWRRSYGCVDPVAPGSPTQLLGPITELRSSSRLDADHSANQILNATAHAFDVIAGRPIKLSVRGLESSRDKVHSVSRFSILATRIADVFH